ncbi:MAG: isocitrate lyase/PEP mutase family protein [Alphaproteobacteria bacterium]|nr:isocitrate lyase/PEP mutase family protein [Alphaproteobacteria bacterium]
MAATKKPSLKTHLKPGHVLIAPGVFEGISARVADSLGFEALYMTGYGAVASSLGLPDAGTATYTEMVSRVEMIAKSTKTPLIADADTGYGGLLNVERTVRGYEAAGASAIQLEDQEFPKKCGHTPGRRVIPTAEMVKKIRVAREARESSDFLIIARTDARTTLGLDEALRRGEAFAKAGADVIFVESPESVDEMRKITASFEQPCLANMVEGGRTPIMSRAELIELGYRIAIFPAAGFLAATAALDSIYRALKDVGSTKSTNTPLYPFGDMNKLMGFEHVWDFDKRHAE